MGYMIVKDNLLEKLDYLKKQKGITIDLEDKLDAPLSVLDKRVSSIYTAEILHKKINLAYFEGNDFRRAVRAIPDIAETNHRDTVLMVAQLTQEDRKLLLKNQIPFVTLEGEMLLPFLGASLFPDNSNLIRSNNSLSPIGQRLYMLILFMMLLSENDKCRLNENNVFKTDGDLLQLKGGREFYDSFGKHIKINNRTSFSRAAKDLISHDLLKSSGSTQGKIYTVPLGSKDYFKAGMDFLESPVDKKVFDYDSLGDVDTLQFMKSSFTALSQVTMISPEEKQTLVTDKKTFGAKFNNLDTYVDDFRNDSKFSIQIEKYDLKFFNVMYRRVDEEYLSDTVDPFNLYLMLYKENDDERVTYELEEMLNNIWRN